MLTGIVGEGMGKSAVGGQGSHTDREGRGEVSDPLPHWPSFHF